MFFILFSGEAFEGGPLSQESRDNGTTKKMFQSNDQPNVERLWSEVRGSVASTLAKTPYEQVSTRREPTTAPESMRD